MAKLDYNVDEYLGALMSAKAHSWTISLEAPREITIEDYYAFSGLTTAAWCEALKIAPATWYKYTNGGLKVPPDRFVQARQIAFTVRAARMGLLSVSDAGKLHKIDAILHGDLDAEK